MQTKLKSGGSGGAKIGEYFTRNFFFGKTNYNFYSYILQSTENVFKVDQELAMKRTLESAEKNLGEC